MKPAPGDMVVNLGGAKTMTRNAGPVMRYDPKGDLLPIEQRNEQLGAMQADEHALVCGLVNVPGGSILEPDRDEALVLCCKSGLLGWVLSKGLETLQKGGQR